MTGALATAAVLAAVWSPDRTRRWGAAGGGPEACGLRRWRSTGRGRRHPAGLVHVVSAVAALLRSGMAPAAAWGRVLGVPPGPDGVPRLADLVGSGTRVPQVPSPRPVAFLSRRGRAVPVEGARAVVAAGRLAATLGTPLAPVLDRLAESLAADEEVEAERRAAVAGPRASAALLSWLPVLGVVLGTALGADPLGVVLRGGLGATSALLGVTLLVVGRWWTRRLVRAAVTAVPDGPPGASWRPGRAGGRTGAPGREWR